MHPERNVLSNFSVTPFSIIPLKSSLVLTMHGDSATRLADFRPPVWLLIACISSGESDMESAEALVA